MATAFWVASYPRSGNTWLRFLLTNLLHGPVTHSDQVAAFVQDVHIHDKVNLDGAGAKLLKTHWPFHDRFPFINETSGAVYLVRHPADVLQSALNYYLLLGGRIGEHADEADRDEYARSWVSGYIKCGGHPRWIEGHVGTWAQNVAAWTSSQLPFPCLVLRYEDIVADPVAQLRKICETVGTSVTSASLDRAVGAAGLEPMAALEETELGSDRPGFFNNAAFKGRDHGFRQIRSVTAVRMRLTAAERARVVDQNAALCERFGYRSVS